MKQKAPSLFDWNIAGPAIVDAFKKLIHTRAQPNQEAYDRLRGDGLVRRDGPQLVPANTLYTRFFKNVL